VVSWAAVALVFLALYWHLHRRARRAGLAPQFQWRWMIAILACAAVAMLIGVLQR
jgi:hypothetical protein